MVFAMLEIPLSPLPELAGVQPAVLGATEAAREQRRLLGELYLNDYVGCRSATVIDRKVGFALNCAPVLPIIGEVLTEARTMIAMRNGALVRSKASLDYLTEAADYDQSSAAVRFAWLPEVLAPIIRYFGMLPILNDIFVTRASAKELLRKTSHMFHADNVVDMTQMKILMHLTDVDEDCGPFHALPAHLSQIVVSRRGAKEGRIADEEVKDVVGRGQASPSVGPAGTFSYCDTTRCLHFGGRPPSPGKPVRELLFIRYVLPTSRFAKGEIKGGLRLSRRSNEPIWNAFIGAELL
jgi:hypothetical protein